MNNRKYHLKVIVDLKIDLDKLNFEGPWSVESGIQDLISHSLFKEHDASYMYEIRDGIKFKNWMLDIPQDLKKELEIEENKRIKQNNRKCQDCGHLFGEHEPIEYTANHTYYHCFKCDCKDFKEENGGKEND